MSKKNEYIEKVTGYINFMLNENVRLVPMGKQREKALPIFITQSFSLYEGEMLGEKVIFAFTANGNALSPAQTKRILALLESKCACVTILVTPELASYNITRLVAQRVNFVVPQKQMFLPSLLVELKNARVVINVEKKKIPPMAQCLLLYHIQMASLDKKNTFELASLFGVSYATANRATRWLKDKNLIALEGTKTKKISFSLSNKELWEAALPLLSSPIEKVLYTDMTIKDAKESGVNALSRYTMLNRDKTLSYAMSNNELKALNLTTDKNYGENRIEIWHYAPELLSEGRYVDKLSLYLSLKDNEDERIRIELESLINGIQW